MALPTTRDITLNPSDPVPSTLLNKLQDCIVGGKKPTETWWIPPSSRTAFEFNVIFTTGGVTANANNAFIRYVSAPLRQGDRVTGLRAHVKGTGAAGNVVVKLQRWKDGAQTDVGVLTLVNPPNAWATYDGAITPFLVGPGESYWLGCDLALTNQAISSFGIDTDRL